VPIAALPLADADADADAGVRGAADDDTVADRARAFTYCVPATVAPTTAAQARAAHSRTRRPDGRARRRRRREPDGRGGRDGPGRGRDLGRGMAAMLVPVAVRAVGRA
jgi:hypothetical protein